METTKIFFDNLFELSNALSIYILVGLFIAGILKEIIPDGFIAKKLGKKSFSSVFKAALFGIPLPLCSCSVIPFASSLKKEGASKGAVQSFLISTPITGVDSILAIYGVFGFFFTAYKVIASFIIAIVAGAIQNLFDKDEEIKKPAFSTFAPKKEESSCCSGSSCCSTSTNEKKSFSLKRAINYGYVTLFGDIAKPLLIGLIIGALFTTFFPTEIANKLFENEYLTYLAVLVISIPLYVCATASLPISAALILSGMSFGAAFMFLSAGPATNSVTIGVVAKTLGKKAVFIYLGVIFVLSFVFGFAFDKLFSEYEVGIKALTHEDESGLFFLSSLILFIYTFYFLGKEFMKKRRDNNATCCSSTSSGCGCH